ncbi:MAG: adenosylcobinamide-GDP ribazoletransferase [Anaerolineae bacterium]
MNLFWLALSFLTTIPAKQIPYIPGGLGKSAAFFPIIGLLIGAILIAVIGLTSIVFPAVFVALFALLAWVLLTGGLHLDGLADCCDGLFGAAPAEKRLEILKDPRTGSFAVIGLIMALGLKAAAIFVILSNASFQLPWLPFVLAPVLARFLILPTALQSQARPGGMGADFASTISPMIVAIASILPILLLLTGWEQPIQLLSGMWLAVITTVVWITLAKSRVGGVTGDVYGAVVETAEISILIGFTLIF